MRYKGKKIETPTYEMVYEYSKKKGFDFDIPTFLKEMDKKRWIAPSTGQEYCELENCICHYVKRLKRSLKKKGKVVADPHTSTPQKKSLWCSIVANLKTKKGLRRFNGIKADEVFNYCEQQNFLNKSGVPFTSGKKAILEYMDVYGLTTPKAEKKPKKKHLKVSKDQEIYIEEPTVKDQYYKDLKDPRWKAFREFIFAVRGCRCEKCGSELEGLVIHHGTCEKPVYHKYYSHPWEYTCNEVVVLCNECHQEVHNIHPKKIEPAEPVEEKEWFEDIFNEPLPDLPVKEEGKEAIYQYVPYTNLYKSYKSVEEASNVSGITCQDIIKCLTEGSTVCGYAFSKIFPFGASFSTLDNRTIKALST